VTNKNHTAYHTFVQAKHTVDHGHEINMFKNSLQCIIPLYTKLKSIRKIHAK